MIEGPIQTNNNGLVFYFDTKEPKSYVGKPTTNLLSYTDFTNIWYAYCGNGDGVVRNTTDVLAPDGTFTATKIIRGTSSTCSGAFYGWGLLHSNGSNLFTAGQTYTASVWARCESGTMQFILGLNDSHSAGTTINTTWQRITFTATASGLDRGLQFITYDTSGRVYYVWRPQTELGSYASQFVASGATPGTRSNTQGLLDLTGQSIISLANAGYNASSEIAFNGSSNYITIDKTATQLGLTSGGQMTVEVFVRLSSLSGYTHIVDGSGNRWHLAVENSGDGASAYFWNGSSYHSTSSPAITANTWVYIAGVQESSLLKIYINGVLATNGSLSSAASNLLQDCNVAIGYWQGNNSRYLNGQIGYVRIYNRALSASEILKNFNSQRSRYSV